MQSADFDRLLAEADATPFVGFDFSWLTGRVVEGPLPWDYPEAVRARMTYPVLDMGTGGGEVFSSLAPFEGLAVATEGWPPNVPVAHRRLRTVGARVVWTEGAPDNSAWTGAGGDLPFRGESFDLVINRHEAFSPTEVFRVLRPGSTFITQQVGERDDEELREVYGAPPIAVGWGLDGWTRHLEAAGFEIVDALEARSPKAFTDVGAIAWYMKAISWEFPGFSITTHRELLKRLHDEMPFTVHEHRYFLEARRPSG